jgi:hypothetical protein
MFKHSFSWLALALAAAAFFACGQDKPAATATAVSVSEVNKKARQCAHDSVCAEVSLVMPQLAGGANPAAIAAVNDSLRALAAAALEVSPALSLDQAFDTSKFRLFSDLTEHLKLNPDWPGSYAREVRGKTLWQSPRFASFQTESYSFTGGAHGSFAASLGTYDLSTGQSVGLTEVVRDTAALVPMLETAFVDLKKEGSSEPMKLSDLLFPEFKNLPVSTNFCLVQEGVRFFYNPYEVAAWAIGSTEITLTWEQLGALSDKKKWTE